MRGPRDRAFTRPEPGDQRLGTRAGGQKTGVMGSNAGTKKSGVIETKGQGQNARARGAKQEPRNRALSVVNRLSLPLGHHKQSSFCEHLYCMDSVNGSVRNVCDTEGIRLTVRNGCGTE